jgi:hypothetical protein
LWSDDGPIRTVTGLVPPVDLPFASVETNSGLTFSVPVPLPTAVVAVLPLVVAVLAPLLEPPLQAVAISTRMTSTVGARRLDR